MVTYDVNNLKRKDIKGSMRTLDSTESIKMFLDNLMIKIEYESGKDSTYDHVFDELYHFINNVRCRVCSYQTYYKLIEYHDALHHRSEELTNCIKNILASMTDSNSCQVVSVTEGSSESLYSISGELLWSNLDFNPKIIKKLINVLIFISKLDISNSLYCEYLRVISSVGSIYKDICADDKSGIHQEIEMIEAVKRYQSFKFTNATIFQAKALYDPNSVEYGLVNFIKDLNNGRPDDSLYNRLTADVRRAFARTQDRFLSEYNMARDSNFSFKSSGVRVNGKSIPALYSSFIEHDLMSDNDVIKKFDEIVKFNVSYPHIPVKGSMEQVQRSAISIPQKKLGRRTIFITNNHIQDRLGWFHNILSYTLQNLPSDATFDQYGRGISFAHSLSSITDKAIYCLDLSKATDTMLLVAQRYVIMNLLLPKFGFENANALSEAWEVLISGDNITKINKNFVKFRLKDGQPQGYLSSFPAFALLHHICVLYTYYCYLQPTQKAINPRLYYRVLGDDSIMMVPDNDKNQLFRDVYINVMKSVNVECNPEKGFSNYGERKSSLTEFAKVTSINGAYFTNTPFNLCASSANETVENYVKYLDWLGKFTDLKLSKEFVIKKIKSKFSITHNQETAIMVLMTNRCDGLDLYNLTNETFDRSALTNTEKFVNWFNFIKTIKMSYYKYILTHSEAEQTIGVDNFLSPEEKIKEKLNYLKDLVDLACLDNLDNYLGVKLVQEAHFDVISESMISVLRQVGEDELVDLIQSNNLINIGYINSLVAKLEKYNLNEVDIERLVESHPLDLTESDFNKMMMLKRPMTFRSWTLGSAQVDKQYFEQLGKLINSNWEEQVSDILYNLYDDRFLLIQKDFEKVLSDDEEDELVDSCLKELDLDLDLNLDFDFNL